MKIPNHTAIPLLPGGRVLQYRSFVAYRASELSPNIVGARLPAIAVGQSTSM